MHANPKGLLKQAVQQCLPKLQSLSGNCLSPHLVWKQTGERQWRGEWQMLPDIGQIFIGAETTIDTATKPFVESFFKYHPEYKGGLSLPRFGFVNYGQLNQSFIFLQLLRYLWKLHKTFDLSENAIDKSVNEVEAFIDKSTVRLLFRSVLLNFHSQSSDLIELPEGLKIRRLSELEISDLHGGSMESMLFQRRIHNIQEFCIEGEIEESKLVEPQEKNDELPNTDCVREKLDRAMLCLRTFKEGYVGYSLIQYFPVAFCPFPFGSYNHSDLYVPFGSYEINIEEITSLKEHAKLIFGINEEAMRMACSRLADAEHRTRAQDSIVDAVIGMEALLLSSINDRQGELSFRFSLNYAMLFPHEQRQSAFKFARDIYGLRSKIAHGSFVGNECKIDGMKIPITDVAKKAKEALREIILNFLKNKDALYKNPEFWQRRYFGLPDLA
jgi:Apea-like HEPN